MRAIPMVFLEGPWKLAMGLHALALEDWLVVDERWEDDTAERRRLSRERPELVHAVLPEGETACREVLSVVVDWLARYAADRFERHPEGLIVKSSGELVGLGRPDPLMAAGTIVQEDLLILGEGDDGSHRLLAGHLCFPLHWKLADKIGQPLRLIHAPVPGFAERLGTPTERLFRVLGIERPVWRANWSLTSSPELCLPDRSDHLRSLDPQNAGRALWLRVERQTLRRLPETGAIVFTIKTYVAGLDEIARAPGVAAGLAARLREMPEAVAKYKGLLAIREPLLQWLDARAVGAEKLATGGR